jgi:hypothetical protein
VEETLAWEAQNRVRTAIAALLAGVLTLAGGIAATLISKDFPSVLLFDGLRDAAGQKVPGGGLKTEQAFFVDDHGVRLIVAWVVIAIGSALVALVLGYLYRATRARGPQPGTFALYAALTGPVLLAVAEVVLQVAVVIKAHDFTTGNDFSTVHAHDALTGGVVNAAGMLRLIGTFALALAFVMISLNAMRVGLLTRFFGVLGIIVGVLFILPLGSQLPIVQAFWLVGFGMIVLGRWPNMVPPAWSTGRAQPWPSQQELREAREAARRGGDAPAARTAPPEDIEAEATTPARPAHPSSKKKKRKRR